MTEFIDYLERATVRYTDDKGYIKVLCPGHPYAQKDYVLEHRLVFERAIQKYLRSDQVVHHINEIKTDNRYENLYLCTNEEHVRIHNRGKRYSFNKKNNIRIAMRARRTPRNFKKCGPTTE